MNGVTLLATVPVPPLLPGDVGMARVRLPLAAFGATGLLPGDTVLVTPAGAAATDGAAAAAAATIAIAWPLPPDAAPLPPPLPLPLPRATAASATPSAAVAPLVGVPLDRTLSVPPPLRPPPPRPSPSVVAGGSPAAVAATVIPALTVVPLVLRQIRSGDSNGRGHGGGGVAIARHAVATPVSSYGGVGVSASASDAAAHLEDFLTSPALVSRPLPARLRVALPGRGGPDGAPTAVWDVMLSATVARGGCGGMSNGGGSGGGSSGVNAPAGVMATALTTRLTLRLPPVPPPPPLPLSAVSPQVEATAAAPPPPCSAAALALLVSLLTADVGAAVAEAGAPPPAGVLLAGPPGVGKTSAVEAAAAATGVPLFALHAAQMERGGWGKGGEGGGEGALAAAFARARAAADGRAAVAAAAVAAARGGGEGSYLRPRPAASAVLLLVDEVDALCGGQGLGGSGGGGSGGGSADGGDGSSAAALAALLDAVGGCPRAGGGYVLVVATTNRPAALPQCLRRRGRLDQELRLAPPDRAERAAIVSALAAAAGGEQGLGGTTAADLAARVADSTPGFVGADLALLADRARRAAADRRARRVVQRAARGEALGTPAAAATASASCCPLRWADWATALRHVGASTLRGPLDATPAGPPDGTAWAAIGGAAAAKARLAAAVGWPPTAGGCNFGGVPAATTTATLALRGRGAPRGVLLYGPPGTGKTALVRAAAAAGAVAFLRLDPAAAYSAYLGEAEATVRAAFATARAAAPAVLFLDELDALVGSRDASGGGGGNGSGDGGGGGGSGPDSGGGTGVRRRVLATLLTEMDGISGAPGVVVVGATNRPDLLDAALLRPGRFDDLLPVPPPATDADRVAVLAAVVAAGRGVPLGRGVDLRRVAAATAGRSGAELTALVREAAMAAVREEVATAAAAVASGGGGCVEQRHFDAAVAAAVPLSPQLATVGKEGEAEGAPTA